MNSAIERLLSLRVSDCMSRNVVSVESHQTMAAAAAVMLHNQVSGAPVVNEVGKCIGMLTATDFMRWEARRDARESPLTVSEAEHPLVRTGADEPYQVDLAPSDRVTSHMATAVQTVFDTDTLLRAARVMCGAHVHRLPVLNASQELVGILSALDIVAATVHAVEE